MQYPEARKYQLFPKDRQLPTVSKQYEPDPTLAMAEKSEKFSMSNGLRMRIKEHNLTRRRKVSVPELGPMTTVQEVAMDSPTIPGRPALHERSISSPVNTWRQNHLADCLDGTKDSLDESSESTTKGRPSGAAKSSASPSRQILTPKDLTPLTIPCQSGTMPGLVRKLSLSRLRSGSAQQEPPTRPSRPEESPKTRTHATPYTPSTTTTPTPTIRSATSTGTTSTVPTPMSAPAEMRNSPRAWEKMAPSTSTVATQHGNIDSTAAPNAETDTQLRSGLAASHKRGHSESGSIMERGRPRKRSDGTPIGGKRNLSKRSVSSDRRAFESLPQGWKSSEAVKNMDQVEIVYLQKQALGQALRFEVLKRDDVESLSKELRRLDERTEYLRRTYVSLRAGRRNLQSRICQYLRSPRVAKFSHESMLKQEEALAELDASIDDWVNKLDQAENRRTRVRQKLLEHVAAASTLSIPNDGSFNETLQLAMGFRLPQGTPEVSTPPRSPAKNVTFHCPSPSPSSSPQRVVARVPSVIPEQPAEETDDCTCGRNRKSSTTSSTLQRMESIRIYADSDVYALLADVESEFTRLNGEPASPERPSRQSNESEEERKVVHRAHSHDALSGSASSSSTNVSRSLNKTPPMSPPAPSPPSKDSPTKGSEFFLSAAVFRPEQPTATA
ncbi:Up-regulated during septation-domain-containing protein [Biscogniauxia marginata]|nr:Up-regulated during septation-domain-containing protein [Biscogniauxia marginata]